MRQPIRAGHFTPAVLGLVLLSFLLLAPKAAIAQTAVVVKIPQGAGSEAGAAPGFYPDTIAVVIGINNTVTWSNLDSYGHTIESQSVPAGAASFLSPIFGPGASFTETFTVAGTYRYDCSLHSWMFGTVVVKAPTSAVPEFPPAATPLILLAAIAALTMTLGTFNRVRGPRPTTLIRDRDLVFPS